MSCRYYAKRLVFEWSTHSPVYLEDLGDLNPQPFASLRGREKSLCWVQNCQLGSWWKSCLMCYSFPFLARFSLREENTHSLQAWDSLLPVEPNLSFDYSFNDYSIAFLDETLPIYFLPRRSGLIGNWLDGLSLRRRKFLQFVRTSTSF